MKKIIKSALGTVSFMIAAAYAGHVCGAASGFTIPVPDAPGAAVQNNKKAAIDYSNAKDGYVMVKYLQKTNKQVKVVIKGPKGTSYTYSLKPDGNYTVFPLTDGNGSYSVGVFEQIDGTKYAAANSATVKVSLTDEFAPYIRPNQYVNYSKDSQAVRKAASLIGSSGGLTDMISAVYNYVIANISYDKELAKNVKSGYLPDVDRVLSSGKGICFDYSAVMAAMLRSLGIPCRLVVGYAGEVYHAWINAYSQETGWVNQLIFFDGQHWTLMDPTFASTANESSEIMKYIGDGNNYNPKFTY